MEYFSFWRHGEWPRALSKTRNSAKKKNGEKYEEEVEGRAGCSTKKKNGEKEEEEVEGSAGGSIAAVHVRAAESYSIVIQHLILIIIFHW